MKKNMAKHRKAKSVYVDKDGVTDWAREKIKKENKDKENDKETNK